MHLKNIIRVINAVILNIYQSIFLFEKMENLPQDTRDSTQRCKSSYFFQ